MIDDLPVIGQVVVLLLGGGFIAGAVALVKSRSEIKVNTATVTRTDADTVSQIDGVLGRQIERAEAAGMRADRAGTLLDEAMSRAAATMRLIDQTPDERRFGEVRGPLTEALRGHE